MWYTVPLFGTLDIIKIYPDDPNLKVPSPRAKLVGASSTLRHSQDFKLTSVPTSAEHPPKSGTRPRHTCIHTQDRTPRSTHVAPRPGSISPDPSPALGATSSAVHAPQAHPHSPRPARGTPWTLKRGPRAPSRSGGLGGPAARRDRRRRRRRRCRNCHAVGAREHVDGPSQMVTAEACAQHICLRGDLGP